MMLVIALFLAWDSGRRFDLFIEYWEALDLILAIVEFALAVGAAFFG